MKFIVFTAVFLCLTAFDADSICTQKINKHSCAKLCNDRVCKTACSKYCHKPTKGKDETCNHVVQSVISKGTQGTQGIETVNQCKSNKSCKCFRCSIHIASIKPVPCTTSMCIINVPTVPPSLGNGVGVMDACKPLMPIINSSYQIQCSMLKAGAITKFPDSYVTPVWGESQCVIIYDNFGTVKCVPC